MTYRSLVACSTALVVAAIGVKSMGQAPKATPPAASVPQKTSAPPAPTSGAARTVPRSAAQPAGTQGPTEVEFTAVTHALLNDTCGECHNDVQREAGLDLTRPFTVGSLSKERDLWDIVLSKLKAREMPPPDVVRPDEQISELVTFLDTEFDRVDRLAPPDPGHVVARRLNRTEYTNTIRDLLAVDFRADKNFPTDDSGDGFDNIGDVLTVSPVLMEKYLSAAGRIAARTLASDPLPKPVEVEYSLRFKNLRRIDPSNVEATHRVDFDADYKLRIGLPGNRAKDAAPVTLGLWVDGRLLKTMPVETKPSGLVYFNPYSEEEMQVSLPEGDHTFRLGFIDDPFVKTLKKEDVYKDTMNKWIGSVILVGPFPSTGVRPGRAKVLVCDPKTGSLCVSRILSTLARRAYRRPVTPAEVTSLMKFVSLAKADGQSVEQGIALAIQAILVSPNFLFHIEHDANPTNASAVHRVSDVELASRLSYFLWNSMPDDELLTLADQHQLSVPRVRDAQVTRMLADPKASALAENFGGQWLETRNLDSIKPDPQKFPAWGPELRDAFKTETRMFFEAMLRENRPISDFLDARFTFLNESLARYYGIDGVEGPDFRRVTLTTDQRGGILGQGSVLAVSSYPTRTSVVIRGKYILNNILGAPPPPPPANVPALDDGAVGSAASLRTSMEKHRADPVCASCHSRMDPLGFGLENYDAIGRWRAEDGSFPVDARGTLSSGASFTGPAEMRQVLAGMLPDFARCLTEKMLTYALGRGVQRFDRLTVRDITQTLASKSYGFQTLVHEVVRSLPFQSRRGEAVAAVTTQ